MNKKIYLGIYSLSLGLLVLVFLAVLVLFGLAYMQNDSYFFSIALNLSLSLGLFMFIQFTIVQTIYVFVMLAKMWGAIQDGETGVTVGEAIGYLFIPLFSLFWIFRAWGSFPTEYNKYIERNRVSAPRISSVVFVSYPVILFLTVVFFIPFLILPFVFLAVISKVCDAVNALSKSVERQPQYVPDSGVLQNQYSA